MGATHLLKTWWVSFSCSSKKLLRKDQRFLVLPCSGRSIKSANCLYSEPIFPHLLLEAMASSTKQSSEKEEIAGQNISFVSIYGVFKIPLKILLCFLLILYFPFQPPSAPARSARLCHSIPHRNIMLHKYMLKLMKILMLLKFTK